MNSLRTMAADRLLFTRLSDGAAILESTGLDAYSEGITDHAYLFRGVVYVELPTTMEFVHMRVAAAVPDRVPREGTVFEFYQLDVVSDGGLVVQSDRGIVGGRHVAKSIGYLVANDCKAYHGPLPSGRTYRSPQTSAR